MSNQVNKPTQAQKPAEANAPVANPKDGEIFTYVGGGTDSPQITHINGTDEFKQKFIRGQAVAVKDPMVLKRIRNNPTFRPGEVSQEEIFKMDESAADHDSKIRDRARRADKVFKKEHGKAKGDE